MPVAGTCVGSVGKLTPLKSKLAKNAGVPEQEIGLQPAKKKLPPSATQEAVAGTLASVSANAVSSAAVNV
jgi:hypothetical protein